jgi:integrase
MTKKIKSNRFIGVYYTQLQSGDKSFYITYKDLRGKKVWKKVGLYSQGIREAYCNEKRNEILNKQKLGENPQVIKNKRVLKDITTFNMVAEKYHANRKLKLSAVNLRDAISHYNNHIEPFIGNMDIEEITEDDIENIMIAKTSKLANKSVNIIVEKISTIFNFATRKKLFKGSNPARYIEKLSEDNERLRFLSKNEIKLLMDNIKDNPILYLFTYISLSTGARLKSVCNIKVQDVDFENSLISILDTKNKSTYYGFIKNDSEFISFFKEQIKDLSGGDFILGNRTLIGHTRYIQRTLGRVLDDLFNKNIIEAEVSEDKEVEAEKRRNKVVVHTLRHTFASQLAIDGTPIYTIQKLMNHKDIKMTLRYAKLSKDSGREFVNAIF